MFINILLLFIFILSICYYYIHYGRKGRLLHLLPEPPSVPIFGHAFLFHVSPVEQWKLMCTLCDKYYPIMKVWGLHEFVVSIRHPDDLEKILSSTKHIKKGRLYNILHPWFGTGLLTSTGVKWQTRRKILTPAFHFNILNKYVDILIKEGDCMTKSLNDVGGTVVKDLLPFISEYTLNAICGNILNDYNLRKEFVSTRSITCTPTHTHTGTQIHAYNGTMKINNIRFFIVKAINEIFTRNNFRLFDLDTERLRIDGHEIHNLTVRARRNNFFL